MSKNNNNNNNNNSDNNNKNVTTTTTITTPEEQHRRESEAVAKESAAEQKAAQAFSEMTKQISIEGQDNSSSDADGEDGGAGGYNVSDGAGEELKQTVRLLVMAENTDALTAVLTRLNGDKQAWEMAQREPIALIAMIIEEQQKRMAELQKKLQQEVATTTETTRRRRTTTETTTP